MTTNPNPAAPADLTSEQALEAARIALHDLQLRIGGGDASVQPSDLEAAERDVRYAETRVQYAEAAAARELDNRQRAHAADLLERLPGELDTSKLRNMEHDLQAAMEAYLTEAVAFRARRSALYNEITVLEANGHAPDGVSTSNGRIIADGRTHVVYDAAKKIEAIVAESWRKAVGHRHPAPFTGDPR